MALRHFAIGGLHGTSTEAIAREAGISQPYLFRLFRTKKELFLACVDRADGKVSEVFRRAAAEAPEGERLKAMGQAYIDELLPDRHAVLMQMQGYVASVGPGDPGARARRVRAARGGGDRALGRRRRHRSGTSSRRGCCSTSRSRWTWRRSRTRASGRRAGATARRCPRRGSARRARARAGPPPVGGARGVGGRRVRGGRVRRAGRRPARHRRRLLRPAVGVDPRARHDRAHHRALGRARRDRARPARRRGRHAAGASASSTRCCARIEDDDVAGVRAPQGSQPSPLVSKDRRSVYLPVTFYTAADEDDGGRRARGAPRAASRA